MKKILTSLVLASVVITLSACEKTKEQFDFSKKPPDEFAVVTRAPLEMPPNYNLRPPRPGAQRPQEDTAIDEAKQVVFGENQPVQQAPTKEVTQGEAILLQKTGAVSVDPDIRDKIDEETAELVKENTSTVDRLLGKAGKKIDAPATIVDPVKESERIIQNKKAGKPITDGKTPSIDD
jgi:hypothetical protein